MIPSRTVSLAAFAFLFPACATDRPAPAPKVAMPTRDAPVVRVGGEKITPPTSERATKDGEELVIWRHERSSIDTPLPVGYPPPTPPGAIELKLYPRVRRAEFDSPTSSLTAFYPLLNHIKSRSIAMTSPVEMDYDEKGGELRTRSMSFLYREVDQGPAGPAESDVVVRDRDEVVVISIGVRGILGPEAFRGALAQLDGALERIGQRGDGTVRTLEYNSPFVPPANRWAEVQVALQR